MHHWSVDSAPEHNEELLGEELLKRGWKQGILFNALSISFTKELIKTCLDTKLVHLDPDIRTLTEQQMSVKEHFASRPLYFDYLTYGGEEVEGAEPYRRM
jgi:hypothetical protein